MFGQVLQLFAEQLWHTPPIYSVLGEAGSVAINIKNNNKQKKVRNLKNNWFINNEINTIITISTFCNTLNITFQIVSNFTIYALNWTRTLFTVRKSTNTSIINRIIFKIFFTDSTKILIYSVCLTISNWLLL